MLVLKFLVVTGTSLGRLQICLARNTSRRRWARLRSARPQLARPPLAKRRL